MMKRKKWSELEEQTLITKYSYLLSNGALARLKTREKKFKPIAEHVNSSHHLVDPSRFPFRWTWRDVSIKVQNMRHQYLGVKQKIRGSDGRFNWDDGENHWENFLRYKQVFGDVELEVKDHGKQLWLGGASDVGFLQGNRELLGDEDDGCDLGFDNTCEDFEEDGGDVGRDEEDGGSCEDDLGGGDGEDNGHPCPIGVKRLKKKRLRLLGAKVLELRDLSARREDRRRERDFAREEEIIHSEELAWEKVSLKEKRLRVAEDELESREFELEEMSLSWARRELNRRLRLERELEEEKLSRMKMEEKREQEEMEWRERMVRMQIEHEKQIIQMHADACQNQMQIIGVMARLMCQFFGSASDGLSAGLGALPPQVLQNLQHPGGLGENGKPDSNSPSEFL